MRKAKICHIAKATGVAGSENHLLVHPGEHLRFWTHVDFLWWADWLGYHVRAAIPYQGMPFLKRLWLNLFASGIVYVLEFKG